MKYTIYRRFAKLVQKPVYDRVSELLSYAGIYEETEIWMGSKLLIAILFGLVGALIPLSILRIFGFYDFEFASMTLNQIVYLATLSLMFGILFFTSTIALIYMHIYYLVHDRTRRVEEVLPDFLMMVAANLRSGMTPFSAFQSSARPEFGPLEKEVNIVASKSLGSESFTDALKDLNSRIRSDMLARTINFFEQGIKSGGKLATLLETTSEEIREMDELKRELMLNTKTYTIFLLFILLFGLPFLLAISSQFIATFTKIQAQVDETSIFLLRGGLVGEGIDVGFIGIITLVLISGTSLLTGIMIGVIREGKLAYGLKYFIPLTFASLAFFIIFKILTESFIGQFI